MSALLDNLHCVEKADDHTTADLLLDTLETCSTTQEFLKPIT